MDISLNLIQREKRKQSKGLELALYNNIESQRGVQAGGLNIANDSRGVQAGVVNYAEKSSYGLQAGK